MKPHALKPQDVLVVLKLLCIGEEEWSFTQLAKSLGLSVGAAHNAVTNLRASRLVFEKDGGAEVARRKLLDFLIYGVPSVFYPIRGGIARGVPTSVFAPPLREKLTIADNDVPMVWPVANGRVNGETLEPLYETVPKAAANDARLYEYLVLVDAVRVGKAREKKMASELLEARILTKSEKESKEPAA